MVKRMIALHLIGLLAAITIQLQAQTLSGTVTDSESHQPLEGVMISVTRGNITIDYTLTDSKGQYSLSWKYSGTLQVSASLLGYRRARAVGWTSRCNPKPSH